MRKAAWGGYQWLLPMLLFLFIIELLSLSGHDGTVRPLPGLHPNRARMAQFIGLDNYRKAMHDDDLFHGVSVTLLYMLIALPVEFLLGLTLAVLISYHLTLKRIVVPLMLIPMSWRRWWSAWWHASTSIRISACSASCCANVGHRARGALG